MKTIPAYLFALLIYGCSSGSAEGRKEVKTEIQHTLQGSWVIRESFNAPRLVLLNHETYIPESSEYYYLSFDQKKNTIRTRTAGEFGAADGMSPKFDLRQLKWDLKGDTLHIYGQYKDYAGSYTLNNFYIASRKGDTLYLTRKRI